MVSSVWSTRTDSIGGGREKRKRDYYKIDLHRNIPCWRLPWAPWSILPFLAGIRRTRRATGTEWWPNSFFWVFCKDRVEDFVVPWNRKTVVLFIFHMDAKSHRRRHVISLFVDVQVSSSSSSDQFHGEWFQDRGTSQSRGRGRGK